MTGNANYHADALDTYYQEINNRLDYDLIFNFMYGLGFIRA